jgi:hypothetical protein
MLNFRLRVPLVLSSLYILFSEVQAQTQPPDCAVPCGESAAVQAGCDMSVHHSTRTAPYMHFQG